MPTFLNIFYTFFTCPIVSTFYSDDDDDVVVKVMYIHAINIIIIGLIIVIRFYSGFLYRRREAHIKSKKLHRLDATLGIQSQVNDIIIKRKKERLYHEENWHPLTVNIKKCASILIFR